MEEILELVRRFRAEFPDAEVRPEEPMRAHTSFRIGGPVTAMVFPGNEAELKRLRALAAQAGVEPLLLGNGTNLLADDAPLDLLVIQTSRLDGIRAEGETLTAECGALLSRTAAEALRLGLTGLEFAHGIPGSAGGAVCMNAGAYGGEMKDVVVSSRCVDRVGETHVYTGAENAFSYRHSRYSDTDDAVVSAVFRLEPGDPDVIRARMEELAARRRASQPLNLPSAGSTFKRPAGGYAAALIEGAGLKGKGFGGACVSEKHAGFVVNRGGATFDDVLRTMEMVREAVLSRSGILLEPEVRIIRGSETGKK